LLISISGFDTIKDKLEVRRIFLFFVCFGSHTHETATDKGGSHRLSRILKNPVNEINFCFVFVIRESFSSILCFWVSQYDIDTSTLYVWIEFQKKKDNVRFKLNEASIYDQSFFTCILSSPPSSLSLMNIRIDLGRLSFFWGRFS